MPLTSAKVVKVATPSLAEDLAACGGKPQAHNVRRAAVALLRYGSEMPPDRRLQLEQLISLYFGRCGTRSPCLTASLGLRPQLQCHASLVANLMRYGWDV